MSQTGVEFAWRMAGGDVIRFVVPPALASTVEDFWREASGAVVLENGAVAFDLGRSKYSISGESQRCPVHFWSEERNIVRRVLEAEVTNGTLRLAVQCLGQDHRKSKSAASAIAGRE